MTAMIGEDHGGAFVISKRDGARLELVRDRSRDLEPPEGGALRELLENVLAINRQIAAGEPLEAILDAALETVLDLVQAERALVVLYDGEGVPRVEAARAADPTMPTDEMRSMSQSIVGEVLRGGRAVLTYDAAEDARFGHARSVLDFRLKSVLCVPLIAEGRTIGCLYTDNREARGMLRSPDLYLIEAFAAQAAIAIATARLLADNQRLSAKLREQLDERTEELRAAHLRLDAQESERRLRYSYDRIVHESPKMRGILTIVDQITDSDMPVLILGESGTGKELLARAIHYNGPRKGEAFVAVNCGAVSATVFESEFFGHVRGAFTGADRNRKGYFEVAHRGTLFLDELGELDLAMQVKLLRALQEREIMPVGSSNRLSIDVRIVAATNQNLEALVAEGRFREDLYYRLRVLPIDVPPLRERREDIPALVRHFLDGVATRRGGQPILLPEPIMDRLAAYDWPGNIRELENAVAYLSVFADIGYEHVQLPFLRPTGEEGVDSASPAPGEGGVWVPTGTALADAERALIEHTLDHTGGSRQRAADLLGIDRVTLYRRLRKYEG